MVLLARDISSPDGKPLVLMAGYTDKPQGSRPNCPECGEHRWSYEGHCLGHQCKPLSAWMDEINEAKVRNKNKGTRKKDPLFDPTSGKKRSRPTGRSRKEAEAWYQAMGKEIPWEDRHD